MSTNPSNKTLLSVIMLILIRLSSNPCYLNKQTHKWTLLLNHTLSQPLNRIVLDVSGVSHTVLADKRFTPNLFLISSWKIHLEKSRDFLNDYHVSHKGSVFSNVSYPVVIMLIIKKEWAQSNVRIKITITLTWLKDLH